MFSFSCSLSFYLNISSSSLNLFHSSYMLFRYDYQFVSVGPIWRITNVNLYRFFINYLPASVREIIITSNEFEYHLTNMPWLQLLITVRDWIRSDLIQLFISRLHVWVEIYFKISWNNVLVLCNVIIKTWNERFDCSKKISRWEGGTNH